MNKYQSQTPAPSRKEQLSLRLNFDEVEAVLGIELPAKATTDVTWWSNDANHAHADGWLAAGWRTLAVDLDARQITFEPRLEPDFVPKRERYGCMAGTITIMPGVDLTAPSDEVWNAELGILYIE